MEEEHFLDGFFDDEIIDAQDEQDRLHQMREKAAEDMIRRLNEFFLAEADFILLQDSRRR